MAASRLRDESFRGADGAGVDGRAGFLLDAGSALKSLSSDKGLSSATSPS